MESVSLDSVKSLSTYLGVSRSTIYRLVETNKIPYIKGPGLGIRFRRERVEEWLENNSHKSAVLYSQLIHNQSFRLTNTPENGIIIPKIGGICELTKFKSKTRFNFGYGAIYQRKTKKGKICWYLDYYDADHKRIQKVAKNAVSKEEAAMALREEVARAFDRKYNAKRKRETIKFKDFAEIYMKNYSMAKKRAWERSDKVYLHANLIPYFGDYELTKIDALLIEQFIAKRVDDRVKKSTINRDLACLKKMFNKAIDWNYVVENPVAKIKLFSENDNVRGRVLSEEEEKRLMETSSEHLKQILTVALNTGMRRAEILNLQWKQVDLKAKRIKVERTKSGKSRFVNINTFLHEELVKLRNRNGQSPCVFFNPETGKPFTTIKTAFNAACRRAAIEGLWFHDLRRTFATRLLQKGADVETVRTLLGHRSILTTQRYTHTDEDRKRAAVELLNKRTEKRAIKRDNLLHICDTSKEERIDKLPTISFSSN